VAGKEAGDWAGDAIRNITGTIGNLAYRTQAGTEGAFEHVLDSANQFGWTTSGTASADITFDASNVVPVADENRPKTSYLLPCIKVADEAVNASQVDMLALVNQVAQINGEKVDKDDPEYRSIVELKASRGTVGTWTITGLVMGKPLYLCVDGTGGGDVIALLTVASGAVGGNTGFSGTYFAHVGNAQGEAYNSGSSMIVIPTSDTVVLSIGTSSSRFLISAYQ
jgi:hypothetical protein